MSLPLRLTVIGAFFQRVPYFEPSGNSELRIPVPAANNPSAQSGKRNRQRVW
jgi:hypothetical protein